MASALVATWAQRTASRHTVHSLTLPWNTCLSNQTQGLRKAGVGPASVLASLWTSRGSPASNKRSTKRGEPKGVTRQSTPTTEWLPELWNEIGNKRFASWSGSRVSVNGLGDSSTSSSALMIDHVTAAAP
jgi:hypothetical protein